MNTIRKLENLSASAERKRAKVEGVEVDRLTEDKQYCAESVQAYRERKLRIVEPQQRWACDHKPVRLTYWPSQARAAAIRAEKYPDSGSLNLRMSKALAEPKRGWWRRIWQNG